MSDPHIYPDPTGNSQPSAPLNLAAGNSSGFVSIQQLASTIGSDNGDAFMYIRLAMSDPAGALSGSRPMPDVILQADGGSVPHPPPVLAQGPLPLYSGNTYVADVSIVQEDVGYPNVWVIKVDFVANLPQPHTWAINIKNNDAVPRYFTWVVSGTLSLTAQPWIDVSPTSLLWEVLINGSAGESVQVTNRGTTAFTVTGITSALPPGFTVALPGSLPPGDSQPLTVTFAAPSSPPPPDGSVVGNSVVGIAPVDGVAGNIVGHNQTLSVSAKVAALEIVLLLDDSGSMTWNPAGDTLSVADQATLSRCGRPAGRR